MRIPSDSEDGVKEIVEAQAFLQLLLFCLWLLFAQWSMTTHGRAPRAEAGVLSEDGQGELYTLDLRFAIQANFPYTMAIRGPMSGG